MAKKEVNKKEVKQTTKNQKNDKNKKTFFKSFKTELKKVVWPTPKQLVNNTATVISIVIIIAAITFVLDLAFELMNTQGINRIRDAVVPQTATEETTNQNTTGEETNSEQNGSATVQVNEDGSTEVVDGDESVVNGETTDNAESPATDNAEATQENAETNEGETTTAE